MNPVINILHLLNNPVDAEPARATLEEASFTCRITLVHTSDEFHGALQFTEIDLILSDYNLKMYDGMSALKLACDLCPQAPFIFVSHSPGEEAIIEAMTHGATDFVLRNNIKRLGSSVKRALQKKSDTALHKQNYRSLVESSPDLIIRYDLEHRIRYLNNRLVKDLGIASADEVIGRRPIDMWPDGRFADIVEAAQWAIATGCHETIEMLWHTKGGQTYIDRIVVVPERDVAGKIIGTLAFGRDITERKQMEKYEHFRSMTLERLSRGDPLSAILEGIVRSVEQLCPGTICSILLLDSQGKRLGEAIAPGLPDFYNAAIDGIEIGIGVGCCGTAAATGERVIIDDIMTHPYWAPYKEVAARAGLGACWSEPIRSSAGQVLGAFAIYHREVHSPTEFDISLIEKSVHLVSIAIERKQASTLLVQREREFRSLAENLPDNIVRYNRQGITVYVNPVLERTLGSSAAAMIGTTPREYYPDGSYEDYAQLLDTVIASGEAGEIEKVILGPDGDAQIHLIRMFPERSENGEVVGVIMIGSDITERKRMEEVSLAHLRFFEYLDRINRAIQGTNDIEQMMSDVLDVVLAIFDCDRAFLVYPCDPCVDGFRVPMERTRPEYPGALAQGKVVPMGKEMEGLFRIVLGIDGPVKFGPEGEYPLPPFLSEQYSVKSLMLMALHPKQDKPWQFGLHQCSHSRVWSGEDERLLQEIGRRLEEGLTSLLMYRNLQASEQQFRSLAENLPVSLVRYDREGRRTYVNPTLERLSDVKAEQMLGRTLRETNPASTTEAYQRMLEHTLATGEKREFEMRLPAPTGEVSTGIVLIAPEHGADGQICGAISIGRDITERKQAEESIQKLYQVVEQSPVSIMITDLSGRMEFVNTKFTQVTGYTHAEALGKNPRILKSGKIPAAEYKRLWSIISSGGIWQGELHNRKKDGELFWEQATISPIKDAENNITHYVAIKEDVTEKKILEEKFLHSQKMEAVGQLAGGVAHDLNNMLGVIIGCADMAMEDVNIDDMAIDAPFRENIEGILTAGLRSAEITRQLLTFSRKKTITPEILDLNNTVEGMLKLLRRLIGEDIELVWLPGADLWPVKMDPSQIDQIMANLCVNARDAIVHTGRVTIETDKVTFDDAYCAEKTEFSPGEYVLISVSDNGCGMNKQTMNRIFEPFFTTKGVDIGTGLGLATVHSIVKENKGFINVYSELEHGTTFKIYLPRHAVYSDLPREEIPINVASRGTETILLVEDEPVVLNMVKRMLENLGYVVLSSTTPEVAIRIVIENSDDIKLLMTDVVMPEMNGGNLAKKVKSFYPDLKCLFMSGYTDEVITRQGILKEEVHFIQKPFSKTVLAARLREVLDSNPKIEDIGTFLH